MYAYVSNFNREIKGFSLCIHNIDIDTILGENQYPRSNSREGAAGGSKIDPRYDTGVGLLIMTSHQCPSIASCFIVIIIGRYKATN